MKKAFFVISFTVLSCFCFWGFFVFAEDTIFLPDLTTAVTGWNFRISEEAIPSFTPEPLPQEYYSQIESDKNQTENQISLIDEKSLKDVPVIAVNNDETAIQKAEKSASSNTEDNPLKKLSVFAGENTILKNASVGVNAFSEVDFDFAKHFALQGNAGFTLMEQNQFTFDAFLDTSFFVKNYLPVDFLVIVGTKSFRTFNESFFVKVGGIYKFDLYKNTLSLNFAKTFSITEQISFSTDYEKYSINVGLKLPFSKNFSPVFYIGAKYCVFRR